MKEDIGKSFKKLVESTFRNIDGILVEKSINKDTGESGYLWGGAFYKTVEDIRAEKNKVLDEFSRSIKKSE